MKTKTEQPACPECEKLSAVSEELQKIGEFLNWLLRDYYICEFVEERDFEGFASAGKRVEEYLAEYFKIDLHKVEQERRALLDWISEQYG